MTFRITAVSLFFFVSIISSYANTVGGSIYSDAADNGVTKMVELFPKNLAKDVNIDTYLKITFDSEPTVGDIGIIAIYDTEDDSLVDKIDLADQPITDPTAFQKLTLETANTKINIIGNVSGEDGITYPNQVRIVNYNPVIVDGRAVKIIPHNNK
ncbi:MAG: hypothetical protein ACOZCE_08690 [Spirochaetota bacterium]